MKIKSLIAIVFALGAVAALLLWSRGRGHSIATAADPRVGSALADPAALQDLAAVTITSSSGTVHLDKDAGATWRVRESGGQPVDFPRLSRLATQLAEAKVSRMVTASAQRIERLGFGQGRLTLTGPDARGILDLQVGKASSDGGVYVRFGDTGPAYQTDASLFLDGTPANWADKTVLDLKPEDIASIGFPGAVNGAALTFKREKPDGGWTSDATPEGKVVDAERLQSWLSTLGTLVYSRSIARDSQEVSEAAPHFQLFRLATFDGRSFVISAGRKPEQVLPPEPATAESADDAADMSAAQPKTIPAGPVVVQYELPEQDSWSAPAAQSAFVVADYYWNQKPATADLFKDAPQSAAQETPAEGQAP